MPKKCSGCQEMKSVGEFNKQTASRDGLQSCCKKCGVASSRRWHSTNHDKDTRYRTVYGPSYRAANRGKLRIESLQYRADNLDQERARLVEYLIANPDKRAIYNVRRTAKRATPEGRATRSAYQHKRWANDPAFKLVGLLRTRLTKAIKRKSKSGSAVKLLGCTIDELLAHFEGLFTEGMTWNNHGKFGWHIDHIRPLCSFDLEDPAQLAVACHYTNLQPLWAKDNLSKNGKHE